MTLPLKETRNERERDVITDCPHGSGFWIRPGSCATRIFVCLHPLLPSFLPSSPFLPPFLSSSGKISLSRSLDLTYSTVEVPIGQSLRIRSTNYVVGVDLSPFMEDITVFWYSFCITCQMTRSWRHTHTHLPLTSFPRVNESPVRMVSDMEHV